MRSVIKIIWKMDPTRMILAVAVAVVTGIVPFFYVTAYAHFIGSAESFLGQQGMGTFLSILIQFLVFGLFNFLGQTVLNYLCQEIQITLQAGISREVLQKVNRLPYAMLEQKEQQDNIYRMLHSASGEMSAGLMALFMLLRLVINVISVFLMLVQFSLWVGFVLILAFIPMILAAVKNGEEDYSAFVEVEKAERWMQYFQSVLLQKKYAAELRMYDCAGFFREKWKDEYENMSGSFLRTKRKMYFRVKKNSLFFQIPIFALLFYMGYLAQSQQLDGEYFSALVSQILLIGSSLSWSLVSVLSALQRCRLSMKAYDGFMAEREERQEEGEKLREPIREIRFEDVSFHYPQCEEQVLSHMSFTMNAGKKYALVGENGAGKSTVIKLILGLYDDYDGNIYINGVERRRISNLYEQVAVVFQDFAQYEMTLEENLTLGNSCEEKRKHLDRWMRMLWQEEEIHRVFPKGYETELGYLGKTGKDLSGGQWQRIALVRALLRKGNFYILDEPTAALDPMAEAELYQNFQRMMEHHGGIIITHRLGAAKLSDEILLIDHGSIKEQGTHEELMQEQGSYFAMFQAQGGLYQ